MTSFSILVLIVAVILFGYMHKMYSYMDLVEHSLNDMELEIDKCKEAIRCIVDELDEDNKMNEEFYVINVNLSLKENMEARDAYYTKERIESYDPETQEVILTTIFNDQKFKELYELKKDSDHIHYISLSQRKYEMFMKM